MTKIMKKDKIATEEFIQWSRAKRKEQDNTSRNIEASSKYFEEMPSKEDDDQMEVTGEESDEQEKEEFVSSEIPMKKEEVVRVYKPKAPYPQRLLGVTKEHENSLPKDSMQLHVEEGEEVNQGSSHSNETESCIEGEFSEPPIQEALDEEEALTIQQHPSSKIKDVKAVETSTKMRIVTEKQGTISMKKRRSKNNPTPDPTNKFTQANHKRKLAGRKHSQQGASTGSFFHWRSFLLTNWCSTKDFIKEHSVTLSMTSH
ncbi:hypothetical protein AHAS_Ahas19G0187500 [Arachis hypogaea]